MRTNIVIDDKLMAEAMALSGSKSKRDAVEAGLKMLVQVKRQAEIRLLRGKIDWQGDLDAMRTD
jgi:Arc/MetJ family transcription regulator